MIEYKTNKSKAECTKLIQFKTEDYKTHKLIWNMDLEENTKIYSSFVGDEFILYCNEKKLLYFTPPKAFYGTIFSNRGKTIIRGKFKLTKNCFWGLLSNILCVVIAIAGSCLVKYNLNDLISCIIISLIFAFTMITTVEVFSCIFIKNAYKKITNFLFEVSETETQE